MTLPDVPGPISPDDHMMTAGGEAWYGLVGAEAVERIKAIVALGYPGERRRILDFGCGHGRVMRHLRAAYPEAELFAADVDHGAADFCASAFGATAVRTTDDFDRLHLPGNLDLVWVGSVFTHIDAARARVLLNALIERLDQGGMVIATFHGRRAVQMHARNPYIDAERWSRIDAECRATGFGHAPYGDPVNEAAGWGVSLSTPEGVMGLPRPSPDIRLMAYTEAGWANHQDIAAWMRWPAG
ncbi:MAG TPA: class I SAM-dependent methyltransferase [Caulobacteraceae bacterium]